MDKFLDEKSLRVKQKGTMTLNASKIVWRDKFGRNRKKTRAEFYSDAGFRN